MEKIGECKKGNKATWIMSMPDRTSTILHIRKYGSEKGYVADMHSTLGTNDMGDIFASISGIRFGNLDHGHVVNTQRGAQ